MFSKLFSLSALLVSVSSLSIRQTTTTLTISTPVSLVECQPAAISFSGGIPQYILAVIPGGQASAAALETLGTVPTSGTYTWNVNLAAGTNITIKVTDGSGSIQYAAPVVIQSGTSTSCIGQPATLTPVGGTTASSVAATTTSATSTTSSSASSSASSSSSSAKSSTSSQATTTAQTTTNGSSPKGTTTSSSSPKTSSTSSGSNSGSSKSGATSLKVGIWGSLFAVAVGMMML